jgi:hypothetical protein
MEIDRYHVCLLEDTVQMETKNLFRILRASMNKYGPRTISSTSDNRGTFPVSHLGVSLKLSVDGLAKLTSLALRR